MLCEICSRKEGNIHIVKVIEGKKIEKWLCTECTNKKPNLKEGLSIPKETSNNINKNLLIGFMDDKNNLNGELICTNCNNQYNDFKDKGLLGCSECYKTFRNSIDAIFLNVYGEVGYIGKIPKKENEIIINNKRIMKLKEDLKLSISKEEYEKAVVIRDEIKFLEDKNKK